MSRILSRYYSAFHKNVKIELIVLFSNYESKYGGSGYKGHHTLAMEELRRYAHGIDYLELILHLQLQLHPKLLLVSLMS
jgi:hypothetical protein